MKCGLLSGGFQRSINNVFLFTIGFLHESFRAIPIMGAFENPFTHTEHGLCREGAGQFREMIDEDNCRTFDGYSFGMQGLNDFFAGKPFFFPQGISDFFFLHAAKLADHDLSVFTFSASTLISVMN